MYWNPVLETMPLERLRALQLRKFQRILGWAYERSPFYRQHYKRAGLEPGDVRTFADIQKVPVVEKRMLRDVQARAPFPYGEILCVPIDEVTEFRQTSGTTGQPVYQADTWQDWELWSECWAYILYAQGYRSSDRVFLPFGYNIFVAFWAGHYGAEKIGCEVVPGGVLNTEARVLKMRELRATAMMATPTYVLNMAETARNKLGLDPARDLQIRKITCAGEPGASIPSTKKRMEAAFGAKVYDHAGATEIGAWGYECEAQSGGLHVNEAVFLAENVDEVTGKLIEEPGTRGKLVITNLDRVAQPCIRFDSKDLIEWAGHACGCGRTFRLMKGGVVGRTDDITKVKGVLLAPRAIEEVVRGFPQLGDEYEVIVTREGEVDEITLRVELPPDARRGEESLRRALLDELRVKTNLGYRLEFHELNRLPRYDGKAKRFKDLRGKSDG
jgi:phenylacetate-CoA ligase